MRTMHYGVILFLCFKIYVCDGLRILGIFPFQAKSHFVMCEELMRGLAEKGHQVDVYSHFPLKTPVPNYQDFSLQGTLPAIANNVTFGNVEIESKYSSMIKLLFEKHQDSMCNLLSHPHFQKLLVNPPQDPPYDLFITELFFVNCYIPFGRHLNVPVIGVVSSSLIDWQYDGFGTPINLAADSSLFAPYVPPRTLFERLDNFITFKRVTRSYENYSQAQNHYVNKYFGTGYPNAVDLLKDISLALINHDVSLNGPKPFAPKVVPVGGLHIVNRNNTLSKLTKHQVCKQVVQEWLDKSTLGCIYVSFGSMARIETFPPHILQAFYKSFQNIAPVRVLLKIAKPEELPAGLPSNVLTQSWLDQIAVLKHRNVKAFLTHGGLMGTQEAVYFGVPMVAVPLYGDQPLNVMTYVRKNIAVKVDLSEISEKSLTIAFNEVLKNPSYRKSMQKVSKKFKDHPMTPLNTAIYWIEYINKYGKDALKSPIEDIPWWQASLLDLYIFIITSIILLVLIATKMIFAFLSSCTIQIYVKSISKIKQK